MTPSVVERAREVIGDRAIEIIPGSLFTARPEGLFDIVVADGMLHHTGDTLAALTKCVEYLSRGGDLLIIGLVNVWGKFWWFGPARGIVRLLGGSDFHRRARWGRRLFAWTRGGHEGTRDAKAWFRSVESWSYDWFANPRWNRHSPAEIYGWLHRLGLEHVGSQPPMQEKAPPRNLAARVIRRISGNGRALMSLYWLVNREPNMVYLCARKTLPSEPRT